MAEAVFSIPVTGTFELQGDTLTIKIKEATITMKVEPDEKAKIALERGKTLFDVVLESALAYVEESSGSEFTAAELLHLARERHPELDLKRNSWGAHVIASAQNHPSYQHYTARRRYFRYLGRGRYSLEPSVSREIRGKVIN
jgi:siderophore synthetase component